MTKTCSRCKCDKHLDEFHMDRSRPDRRQRTCKSCVALWHKSKVGRAVWRKYSQSEKGLIVKKRASSKYDRSEKGRIVRRTMTARWKARNAFKAQAHQAVSKALKLGHLKQQCCEVCGNAKTEGHHADYAQPLTVNWLCKEHHVLRHKTNKEN